MTKSEIYAAHGIEYKAGKINSPIGWINPLLVDGNSKIGKGVFHFSMLAGNKEYTANVNGKKIQLLGTCGCTCENGYCTKANYNYQSTIDALAIRTIIAREYMDFCERAITAQIQADSVKTIRIHATGDFFSRAYLEMWKRIVASNPAVVFWTYTKETAAENAFDEFENANIVKSNVPMLDNISSDTNGYNFGHIDYIIALYNALRGLGKSVYICRCGIDKNQHCTNCKGCAKSEYVLFLEHGTDYNPAVDPDFPALCKLIESQGNLYLE